MMWGRNTMAGHSKWKNIQHRKGRQDAKRAKIFTKISKEIYVAVKKGGDDPQNNTMLRMALNKAKQANMPNDNIERTIKKASGDIEGLTYEEMTYEGYGPHGVAVMVEVLTDNRNRSAAEIRHIFNKYNGNLGESGCVSYLFDRKGVLEIPTNDSIVDEEALMLEAIEAGAEDVEVNEDRYTILTDPADYESVKQSLERAGYAIVSSEVTMIPSTTVDLDGARLQEVVDLIDALEDNDDVQEVYANLA